MSQRLQTPRSESKTKKEVFGQVRWNLVERRQNVRYPLVEVARYKLRYGRNTILAGVGQTVNLSSSGALLRVQDSFRVDDLLEVSVEWPVLLDGSVRIQLLVRGGVVRVEPGSVALRIHAHEFRTRKPVLL